MLLVCHQKCVILVGMDDGSSQKQHGLLKEWSMLVRDFMEAGVPQQAVKKIKKTIFKESEKKQALSRLSVRRKKLYQEIENIKREIELNYNKIENLKLVGSDDEDIYLEIDDLKALGEKFSQELQHIEQEIKSLRYPDAVLVSEI